MEKDKISEEIRNHYKRYFNIADDSLDKFSQLIWENPKQALYNFEELYHKTLDKAYTNPKTGENNKWMVYAYCGGPHEAIPSAFYNSVGAIYPFLDRETKNYALEKILKIFDYLRNDYVQISHTSYIREPLLLSDIQIVRGQYWPGLEGEEGERLIKKHKLFCDFKSEFIDGDGFFNKDIVNSDFIVAYSLLRSDFCDWGESYIQIVNSNFLERVVKGIVGMRFAHPVSIQNLSQEEIEMINEKSNDSKFYDNIKDKLKEKIEIEIFKRKNRLKELLPVNLHSEIEKNFNKQDWVDWKLFMWYHKSYLLKSYIDSYLED